MITEIIKKQIIEAMKAKDEIRLSTLKLLSSELHNAKIEKRASGPGGDLNEKEEIEVVRREGKKRKEAIEALRQVLRPRAQDRGAQGKLTRSDIDDRISREEKELEILQEFLPKDLSEEELKKIVDETVAETGAKSLQEMGRIIGAVMGKVKGRADGKIVSELVKVKLK